MTNLIKIALGTTLALAAFASPAMAQDQKIAIKYADLDLASAAGQRALALRIDRAAHNHCDTVNERFGPEARAAQAECRASIIAQANAVVAQRLSVRLAAR